VSTVTVEKQDPPVELTRELPPEPLWKRYGLRIWLGRALVLAVFIGFWWLASGRIVADNLISNPGAVASQLWDWTKSGYIFEQTWVTLKETLEGFVIGAIAGIAFGVALGIQRWAGDMGEPFLVAAYGLPKVALAPLFIVWFGIGSEMKVVLAALSVFFMVFFSTFQGIRQTDVTVVNVLRTMGADRWQVMRKVMLPGAKPWIYSGLRLGLPYGFVGAIVGEIVASNQGLGYLISYSASVFHTAGLMAALVALAILTTLLNAVITAMERRSLRWQEENPSRRSVRASTSGAGT
jgi:NitT/TauT family transport system permease protein